MGTVTFTRIIMSPQVERGHLPLLLAHGQEMPATQPVVQSHFPAGVCCALLDCIRSCTLSSLEVCKKKFEKPQRYHSYHASGWRDDLSKSVRCLPRFHVFMMIPIIITVPPLTTVTCGSFTVFQVKFCKPIHCF